MPPLLRYRNGHHQLHQYQIGRRADIDTLLLPARSHFNGYRLFQAASHFARWARVWLAGIARFFRFCLLPEYSGGRCVGDSQLHASPRVAPRSPLIGLALRLHADDGSFIFITLRQQPLVRAARFIA